MEIKNQTETSAELYLYGDIMGYALSEDYKSYYPDDKCPKDIKDFLDEIGEVDHLDIHINSGGGSVFGGIAIYNLLKNYKASKTVYIDGIAASIASVIACVGDKIIFPKNATFMIHKPMNSYFFTMMNADELRKDADTLDNCQKAIMNTYMSKVKDGVTRETIEELVNAETWLIGEEAEQYFDFDIEENVEAAACTSDYFEKYEKVPEALKAKQSSLKATIHIDTDSLAEKVVAKLKADAEKEREAKKNQLLEDLDLI
jgi:ATP-dependent protease ClpP protease subunit